MSQSKREGVPEDMPIPRVPIDMKLIAEVAQERDIEPKTLVEAVETIDKDLAERSRDLTEEYTSAFGDDALLIQADFQQHLYVDPDEWDELETRVDLSPAILEPARACHEGQCDLYVERIDRVDRVARLENNAVFIMPTPIIQDLIEGGLSLRQAAVQTLRMQGDSHQRMAEKLGPSPGTIKRHCHRIDAKIEQARKLLDVVDAQSE